MVGKGGWLAAARLEFRGNAVSLRCTKALHVRVRVDISDFTLSLQGWRGRSTFVAETHGEMRACEVER
jgi:hypothetical protein